MRPTKVELNSFRIWANILNMTEGRFFSVVFRKADGSIRNMNGRIFERIDPESNKKYINVRDVKLPSPNNIRKINPENIIRFKCQNFKVGYP